jgi:pimeloyl-ACP methyl ester carboxylesterase
VLVHGACADGSSWAEVIARLQAAGLHVTAVQNPLTSLADSVALPGKFPTMPVCAGVLEQDGFTYLSEDAYLKYFANGVAPEKAQVLYAEQEPTAATLFGGRTSVAAWRSKPSWYAVSKLDQTISPDLERFLAQRMKATTVELDAGHLSLVSHADEISALTLDAAGRRR